MMAKKPATLPVVFVNRLCDQYGLRLFVETGSLDGRTAVFCSPLFERVFSVELSPRYFCQAKRLASKCPNVEITFGNSPNVLPLILPRLTGPTLFWLDAHWCGCGTPRLAVECPLLDELRVIGGLRDSDVVMIDDARLFLNPPGDNHRPEEWPTYDDICRVVGEWSQETGEVHIEIIDDVIAITRRPVT